MQCPLTMRASSLHYRARASPIRHDPTITTKENRHAEPRQSHQPHTPSRFRAPHRWLPTLCGVGVRPAGAAVEHKPRCVGHEPDRVIRSAPCRDQVARLRHVALRACVHARGLLTGGVSQPNPKGSSVKSLPNIDKSVFHRGEYVGYAAGTVWRLRRGISPRQAIWSATPRDPVALPLYASTLEELSRDLGRVRR